MFEKILVALDPLSPNGIVFDEAVALAQAMNADLELLSVLSGEGEGALLMAQPEMPSYHHSLNDWNLFQERYQAYQKHNLKQLEQLVHRATELDVKAACSQSSGSPGRVICKTAATNKADLLIVGSHGRKGMDELLLGSVSNYVIHHAPCSVMVIHISDKARKAAETSVINEQASDKQISEQSEALSL